MPNLEAVQDPREEPAEEPTPETVRDEFFIQPSVRVFQTWTPTQIRRAESSADSGWLSQAAELCDQLLADDKISGAIESRTGGLQGLPLAFEDGRGDEAGESPLSAELTEDWWRMFPETESKQLAAWGIMLGVGFAQQVWFVNEDGRFQSTLDVWHPKHFRFNQELRRWIVQTDDGGETIIEPNDAKWIVYTPYGRNRPWSRGLWRGLGRWWMLKSFAISDWGQHGEQASRTVVTPREAKPGVPNSGKSPMEQQRSEIANDLHMLGKDGVIVLPQGFEYDLVESTADTTKLYGAQIDFANKAIAIAIVGQNLTSDVESGSLAAASVHERVEARFIRADAETLSTTVRAQVLVWWTKWNFGESAKAPWPRWDTDPPEDQKAKAEVFDLTAEALVKLKASGHEVINLEEMAQDYGIPPIQVVEGDEGGSDDGAAGGEGDSGDTDDASGGGDGPASGDGTGGGSEPTAQVRLATGDPIVAAMGFLEGQGYADRLADQGARLQAKDNRESGFVDRLTAALDAEDYGEIRAAVMSVFADEDPPEDVAEHIEHLFIMAQRAGHTAVDQDA